MSFPEYFMCFIAVCFVFGYSRRFRGFDAFCYDLVFCGILFYLLLFEVKGVVGVYLVFLCFAFWVYCGFDLGFVSVKFDLASIS